MFCRGWPNVCTVDRGRGNGHIINQCHHIWIAVPFQLDKYLINSNFPNTNSLSWTHLLISKISHVCQEIHDIKEDRKLKSNLLRPNYTNTSLDEGQTDRNYTQEPGSNNSAKEDSGDEDDWGGTYSSHSTLCCHEPNNPNNPSHHAPIPPSPNPPPSESILEPPGDRSPSPASKIVTSTPSSLIKLEQEIKDGTLTHHTINILSKGGSHFKMKK